MKRMIQILCRNDGRYYEVAEGSSLRELSDAVCPQSTDPKSGKRYPVLAALVDHKLKSLDFTIFYPHEVLFIGFNHPDGRRTYMRSLAFVLQRAVRSLMPDKVLKINHSLPSGMYCKLRGERISDEDILRLREEMRRLIAEDLPFSKRKIHSAEAEAIFRAQKQPLKADLIHSVGRYFWSVYTLDGVDDSFHGPLVPSTGCLKVFDLMPFHHGFCLHLLL